MFVQTFRDRGSLRRGDSNNNRRSPPRRTMSANRGSMRDRILMGLRACTSGQRCPDDDDDPPNDRQVADISSTEGGQNSSSRLEHTLSQQSSMTSSSPHSASRAISNRSPSRLSLIRNSARNSRVSSILSPTTCAICLENMKAGEGQALFTSECNHTFHFACIASNVRHGNLLCPNCRAKWKEVPWQAPADVPANDSVHRVSSRLSGNLSRSRISQHVPGARSSPGSSPSHLAQEVVADVEEEQRRVDPVLRILDESIANARGGVRGLGPREPDVFDDDEALGSPSSTRVGNGGEEQGERTLSTGEAQEESPSHTRSEVSDYGAKVEHEGRSVVPEISVIGYTEVDAVPATDECETFTVLVNLKSALCNTRIPRTSVRDENETEEARKTQRNPKLLLDPSNRAPLDLVTVLDVSGSMKGTKLVLLKRAMDFVISNLSPSDRLSVVSFSSVAQRVSPLRRMVEDGRQFALGCVASLVSTGGTNIAEGLRKGAKVLEERRMRNPVASIMLLSDGQDTTVMSNRSQFSSFSATGGAVDCRRRLLPRSIRHALRHGQNSQIPVHTFGFGADHDAATMHSISDASGGTFSFIQSESAVQDAFAQCIGGLLSVVVQDAHLAISAGAPGVRIKSIQAGSYETSITDDGRQSMVRIGDLYAEEERNILIDLKVPSTDLRPSSEGSVSTIPVMELLRVSCSFRDPVINSVAQTPTTDINIARPEFVDTASQTVRLEVDRQSNRVRVAESIVQAGALADAGDISSAQEILSIAKESLLMSPAFQAADQLCLGLETQLLAIQTRMANRQMYERSGRAYILSAQSSHLRQRATTRGDFSENCSREYQTPSMADMVTRSQILQLPRAATASTSGSPTREARRSRHSGRSVPSSSPSRMLLLRS